MPESWLLFAMLRSRRFRTLAIRLSTAVPYMCCERLAPPMHWLYLMLRKAELIPIRCEPPLARSASRRHISRRAFPFAFLGATMPPPNVPA